MVCDKSALAERLEKDVERGIRMTDVIDRSLARLPFYHGLNTVKIDTSDKMPEAVVEEICQLQTES